MKKNLIEIISAEGNVAAAAKLGPRNLITMAKEARNAGYGLQVCGFPVREADRNDMADFHSEFSNDESASRYYARWVRDRILADLKDVDADQIERRAFKIAWTAPDKISAQWSFQLVTEGVNIRHDFYTSCERIGIKATNYYLDGYGKPPTEHMFLGINFAHSTTWEEAIADLAARGWDIEHTGDVPEYFAA